MDALANCCDKILSIDLAISEISPLKLWQMGRDLFSKTGSWSLLMEVDDAPPMGLIFWTVYPEPGTTKLWTNNYF